VEGWNFDMTGAQYITAEEAEEAEEADFKKLNFHCCT